MEEQMNSTAAIAWRMAKEIDARCLWKFAFDFGVKGMLAVQRYKRRLKAGRPYPAFMVISVTSRCNLKCQGCWVTQDPEAELSVEQIEQVIAAGRSQGSSFFGILGGEPLLHEGLLDIFARHRNCYFQLFTNGTLLTDEVARKLRRLGNVTPLISVEGLESVSDTRRGGDQVYDRAMAALDTCRRHKLVTGVATSVCKSNYDDLVSDKFLDALVARGVHYMWYYIYRPVGVDPAPKLALDADQIAGLRRFMVDARMTTPLVVVDAYWDAEGEGICPAAVGLSYHVSPTGFVEPCPVIQLAKERIGPDLVSRVEQSEYLAGFRELCQSETRGCILLDNPGRLRHYAIAAGAEDSSGRHSVLDELAVMRPKPSHAMETPIPERNWFYRVAKRNFFFGFGAYG
jgi:MoaA/NifB/PqqE/SkfB family radical SAM enzyme